MKKIAFTIVTLVVGTIALSGCASNAFEIMKNPQTGDIRECKVDPWGDIQYQRQVDTCVAQYEKAGYQKVK